MSAQSVRNGDRVVGAVNEVRLVGKISQVPQERVLPSGDVIWTFRVVVARGEDDRSRQRVDSLECTAWGGRVRRSAASWLPGDQVEVTGSLRRRFFRAAGAVASRVEVDVSAGRIIRRAGVG